MQNQAKKRLLILIIFVLALIYPIWYASNWYAAGLVDQVDLIRFGMNEDFLYCNKWRPELLDKDAKFELFTGYVAMNKVYSDNEFERYRLIPLRESYKANLLSYPYINADVFKRLLDIGVDPLYKVKYTNPEFSYSNKNPSYPIYQLLSQSKLKHLAAGDLPEKFLSEMLEYQLQTRNFAIAKILMNRNIFCPKQTLDGDYLLYPGYMAICENDLDFMNYVLSKKPYLTTKNLWNLLILVNQLSPEKLNRKAFFDLLIAHGANTNIPFYYADYRYLWFEKDLLDHAQAKGLEIPSKHLFLGKLIEYNKLDLLDKYLKEQKYPIHNADFNLFDYAFQYENIDALNVLLQNGLNLPETFRNSWPILHYSIYYDKPKLFNFLIKQKVDLNKQDMAGWTALHYSVQQRKHHYADLLVKAGANTNIKNNNGFTIYHQRFHHVIDFKKVPKEVHAGLKDTIIPSVEFIDAKPTDVFKWINEEIKRLKPESKLNIKFIKNKKYNEKEHLITLEIDEIPIGDLIYYICKQTNLDYEISGNAVYIGNGDAIQNSRKVNVAYFLPFNYFKSSFLGEPENKSTDLAEALRLKFLGHGVRSNVYTSTKRDILMISSSQHEYRSFTKLIGTLGVSNKHEFIEICSDIYDEYWPSLEHYLTYMGETDAIQFLKDKNEWNANLKDSNGIKPDQWTSWNKSE